MNLRELEYMLALNEHRSITAAARELHITQPTLSIFLTNLEQEQGGLLFERIGKKLHPTELGRSYINYAHQITALRNDYELEKSALLKEKTGELHFGCLERRISNTFPREIRIFQETHPGIRLTLHSDSTSHMINQLLDGALDLIYINTPSEKDLNLGDKVHELITRRDHILLVLPENHPLASKARKRKTEDPYPWINLKLLKNETFYVLPNGRALRDKTDALFASCSLKPNQVAMPTIDIACQMAAEGLGATFTMESYTDSFHYDRPVRYFLVGDSSVEFTWRLLWRSSTVISNHMQDFIHQITERAADTPRQSGSDESPLG